MSNRDRPKDWVDRQLENPEFRVGFEQELASQRAESSKENGGRMPDYDKWIGLKRGDPNGDFARDEGVSSLEVNYDHLRVVGVLPHGCKIAPKSLQDAENLIEWLEGWRIEEMRKDEVD